MEQAQVSANLIPARGLKQPFNLKLIRLKESVSANLIPARGLKHGKELVGVVRFNDVSANLIPARGLKLLNNCLVEPHPAQFPLT